MSTDSHAATRELRDAIRGTTASERWPSYPHPIEVDDLVQHSIVGWVDEIASTLRKFDESLEVALSSPGKEDVPDHDPTGALEDALVAAVAIRDCLRSVAALVLGTKCLKRSGPGVKFEPNESDLRRELGDLAHGGMKHAGRVKAMFEELSEHDAITMRNGILHALAPFPELRPICWIQKAILNEEDQIIGWEPGPLYPEGSVTQEDANPITLFRWARTTAEDVRQRLIDLTLELAELISEKGKIEPPPSIWVPKSGPARLEPPKPKNPIVEGLTFDDGSTA